MRAREAEMRFDSRGNERRYDLPRTSRRCRSMVIWRARGGDMAVCAVTWPVAASAGEIGFNPAGLLLDLMRAGSGEL